jgi:hypothetical protein
MRGAIPSLPQYTFMAWCSVKKEAQGQLIFTFTDAVSTLCEQSALRGWEVVFTNTTLLPI